MYEVEVKVKVKVGNDIYVYEFDEQPTEQDITDAFETIGGRPKRD